MPGTNNFLEWNPSGSNQESDAQFAADAQRISGATSPSLFAALLGNKLFFQWSKMVVALAQMMAGKGYNMLDSNLTNLVGSLTNIITQADLPTVLNNTILTGNPTAPTPLVGDNDTTLATTKFVKDVLGAADGFDIFLGVNGFIKLPSVFGGLILQWATGPINPVTGEQNFSVNFPLVFPHNCYNVQVSVLAPNLVGNSGDFSYQVISKTTASVHIQLQEFSNGRDVTAQCMIFAIGN